MRKLSLMAVGACALWQMGCGPADDKKKTIELVYITSLTGNESTSLERLTTQMAVDEINAQGGVLGAELKLTVKDDQSTADGAVAAAESTAELGVAAAFGLGASSRTLKAIDVLAPKNIVLMSASSTSPLISTHQDNGYLYRTCPSDALQGTLLARRAKNKHNLTKAAVIHVPGAYGEGLANQFKSSFEEAGGTITTMVGYTEGQTSYQQMLTDVYATNPDAILLVSYNVDAAQIVKDYNTYFTTKNTFWIFTDSIPSPEFITGVGTNNFNFQHEGAVPGPSQTEFAEAFRNLYQERFNTPIEVGNYDEQSYDGVYLVALAMEASGKADGPGIKEKITAVSKDGKAFGPGQWKEAVDAIKAGDDINYEGAGGNVDLDANGDVVSNYDIWKVIDGTAKAIESDVSP